MNSTKCHPTAAKANKTAKQNQKSTRATATKELLQQYQKLPTVPTARPTATKEVQELPTVPERTATRKLPRGQQRKTTRTPPAPRDVRIRRNLRFECTVFFLDYPLFSLLRLPTVVSPLICLLRLSSFLLSIFPRLVSHLLPPRRGIFRRGALFLSPPPHPLRGFARLFPFFPQRQSAGRRFGGRLQFFHISDVRLSKVRPATPLFPTPE